MVEYYIEDFYSEIVLDRGKSWMGSVVLIELNCMLKALTLAGLNTWHKILIALNDSTMTSPGQCQVYGENW